MSILLDATTRVLVQGISGQMGRFSARDMRAYGTNVVAGCVPGRGGMDVDGVPVFPTVAAARAGAAVEATIIYVPPPSLVGAAIEAFEAGCRLAVGTADEVPVLDAIEIRAAARANGAVFVGPNTPGLISPGKAKLGFMPSFCYRPGGLGVVSRSGSLSYEVCKRLTLAGIGQSTVVGIGGDSVKGTTADEAIELFHADPETVAILHIGEIGGSDERAIAAYLSRPDAKPTAALIVGRSAPPGKKMGHAAALISSRTDTHESKVTVLRSAGASVANGLSDVVAAVTSLPGMKAYEAEGTGPREAVGAGGS